MGTELSSPMPPGLNNWICSLQAKTENGPVAADDQPAVPRGTGPVKCRSIKAPYDVDPAWLFPDSESIRRYPRTLTKSSLSAASRMVRDQSAGSGTRVRSDRGRSAEAVSSGRGRASRQVVSGGYATRGVCALCPACGPPHPSEGPLFARLRRYRPRFPESDPLPGSCAAF